MKKSELRELIREEYKNISEKFRLRDYEDVLQGLNNVISDFKAATDPVDPATQRKLNTFLKKLEKLTDDYESLLMKMDKQL